MACALVKRACGVCFDAVFRVGATLVCGFGLRTAIGGLARNRTVRMDKTGTVDLLFPNDRRPFSDVRLGTPVQGRL